MSELKPSDLVEAVRAVMAAARRGKGDRPYYLTAFQILDRLPADLKEQLIGERTAGGKDAGVTYAASGVVSRAAQMAGAEIDYIDTIGLRIDVAGALISPSYEVCALYRLPAVET